MFALVSKLYFSEYTFSVFNTSIFKKKLNVTEVKLYTMLENNRNTCFAYFSVSV